MATSERRCRQCNKIITWGPPFRYCNAAIGAGRLEEKHEDAVARLTPEN